jgi:hypothetical protein
MCTFNQVHFACSGLLLRFPFIRNRAPQLRAVTPNSNSARSAAQTSSGVLTPPPALRCLPDVSRIYVRSVLSRLRRLGRTVNSPARGAGCVQTHHQMVDRRGSRRPALLPLTCMPIPLYGPSCRLLLSGVVSLHRQPQRPGLRTSASELQPADEPRQTKRPAMFSRSSRLSWRYAACDLVCVSSPLLSSASLVRLWSR